jgi:hypothetical protein
VIRRRAANSNVAAFGAIKVQQPRDRKFRKPEKAQISLYGVNTTWRRCVIARSRNAKAPEKRVPLSALPEAADGTFPERVQGRRQCSRIDSAASGMHPATLLLCNLHGIASCDDG